MRSKRMESSWTCWLVGKRLAGLYPAGQPRAAVPTLGLKDLTLYQAMEICGGARGDCDGMSCVVGALAGGWAMQISVCSAKIDGSESCGWADCEVRTPRQQSWLQQPVLRTVSSFPSPSEP